MTPLNLEKLSAFSFLIEINNILRDLFIVIILKVRDKTSRNVCDLASPYFSDCMGCLTENRFCDTRYRIDCDLSFVFCENNCPYILQYPTRLMNLKLKYTIK